MVNVYRKEKPPLSLKIRYQKALSGASATYDSPVVRKKLRIDFNNKCYLCESIQNDQQPFIGGLERIEHFLPHQNSTRLDLKFKWENLFLSCDYCNSAKGQEDNLIDCTSNTHILTDTLKFTYVLGTLKPLISIEPLFLTDPKAVSTQKMLNKIYNEPNTNLQLESANKLRLAARKSFNDFIIKLEDLNDHPTNKTKENLVREELSSNSPYLSFKISYLKSSANLMTKFGHLIPANM